MLGFHRFSSSEHTGYRFGFNGMEKDDEVRGNGNSLDFGARIYDPRIGRWLSTDPLQSKYPGYSPYVFSRLNPILYLDSDGREWVNAHEAEVVKLEQALLNNPDSKSIQRELRVARDRRDAVNVILKNMKEGDSDLYDYIDNLTAMDKVTGATIKVKVNVSIDFLSGQSPAGEDASTMYRDDGKKSNGTKVYMEYNGLEGIATVTPAPINKNDEVGFDITLYTSSDFADNILANEAGDVMFRMEYPDASYKSGSDANKTDGSGRINWDEYMKPGGAGSYSEDVQSTYKSRKKEKKQTGGNAQGNPYPLKK